MEGTKPQTAKRPGSSHIIDLRQQAAAAKGPAPTPVKRPAPAPMPAPKAKAAPVSRPQVAPVAPKPAPARQVQQSAPRVVAPSDPDLSQRKFWPAFWRFLVLLIVLGVVVVVGVYAYLTVVGG